MRYIEYREPRESNGMAKVVGIIGVFGFLAILGISGAVETQPNPTCEDYQASQDWQRALHNNCPFIDENGEYLYTWTP